MSSWLASRGSGSFKGELLADEVVRFGTTQLGSKGYVDSSFHCDIFPGVANLMPLRSCRCPETWLRWNETVRSLPGRQSAHLPMARIALSTLGRYGSGTRYSSRVGGCSKLPRDS